MAARFNIGTIAGAVRKRFFDTFVRSNTSGGPGTATDGSQWTATRGTMVVSSNTLTSSDSVSNYPMVTVDMAVQDAAVEVTASATGQVASLWVTDSNNWWGVQTFSQSESCNCGQQPYSCNCGTTYYSCNCSTTYYCTNWGCGSYQGSGFCNVCQSYGSYYSCQTCSSYSCQTCYTYACSTCYPNYMRMLQMVSGTVSVLTSWAISSAAAAFRVKTASNQVTIQAYSDSALTSQIGSNITYDASSPTKTTRFGISLGPSSYNQGTAISNVTIKRNP